MIKGELLVEEVREVAGNLSREGPTGCFKSLVFIPNECFRNWFLVKFNKGIKEQITCVYDRNVAC